MTAPIAQPVNQAQTAAATTAAAAPTAAAATTATAAPTAAAATTATAATTSTLQSAAPSESKSCWSKMVDCLRKVPLLKYLVNYFFPKKVEGTVTDTTTGAATATQLTAEQLNKQSQDKIVAAFATAAPSPTDLADCLGKFEKLKNVRLQMAVITKLQDSANCDNATFLKFFDKLPQANKEKLHEKVKIAQNADAQQRPLEGSAIMRSNPKDAVAKAGVAAYIKELDDQADVKLVKEIKGALDQGCNLTNAQQDITASQLNNISSRALRLTTLSDIVGSQKTSPELVGKFVFAMPADDKAALFARVQAKHEARVEGINNQKKEAHAEVVDAAALDPQAAGTAPVLVLDVAKSGEEYFKTHQKGRFVRESLAEMNTAV